MKIRIKMTQEAFKWQEDITRDDCPKWIDEWIDMKLACIVSGILVFFDGSGAKQYAHNNDYVVRYSTGELAVYSEEEFNECYEVLEDDFIDKEKAIDTLISGLIFDGSHHKQYYIQEGLRLLGFPMDRVYELLAKENNLSLEDYLEQYGTIEDGIIA